MDKALKDAICVLMVYHFADVYYKARAEKAFRRLKKCSVVPEELHSLKKEDSDVAAWVDEKYGEILDDHVRDHWPEGYSWTHDFWGAKCWFYKPGWDAPQGGGYYTGDSQGMPKMFSCWDAVEEYTQESLKEAGHA